MKSSIFRLSFLFFSILLINSVCYSLNNKNESDLQVKEFTEFKESLEKKINLKECKSTYDEIRKSGNKSTDEKLVQYILESKGYKDWDKLNLFEQGYIVTQVTGQPYNNLRAISTEKYKNKDEANIADRITKYYQNTYKMDLGPTENMWLDAFSDLKYPIHEIFVQGDQKKIKELLNNPANTNLFYGFDNLCLAVKPEKNKLGEVINGNALQAFDLLKTLAAAVGVNRFYNPEQPLAVENYLPALTPNNVEKILLSLDKAFGFKIDFPNPYPGELGLVTSRGIASYRAIQSLYQAWKTAQVLENCPNCRVLEIGGGLGRAAYYARKFGITNYTIVDLPMSGVAQAHFLASVLGPDAVSLYGENKKDGIQLMPPHVLFSKDIPYDVVVNFDGLTEMSQETGKKYWDYIKRNSPLFLSVNHEANPYTVHDFYTASNCKKYTRVPYWLRNGYIEETIAFSEK